MFFYLGFVYYDFIFVFLVIGLVILFGIYFLEIVREFNRGVFNLIYICGRYIILYDSIFFLYFLGI